MQDRRFELNDAPEGETRALVQRDGLVVPDEVHPVAFGAQHQFLGLRAEDRRGEERSLPEIVGVPAHLVLGVLRGVCLPIRRDRRGDDAGVLRLAVFKEP